MHTMYYGSVFIAGCYEHFRSLDRRVVVKWMDRITKKAWIEGKKIYAPKIVPETVSDFWDVVSGDDVILDWHPEWREEHGHAD